MLSQRAIRRLVKIVALDTPITKGAVKFIATETELYAQQLIEGAIEAQAMMNERRKACKLRSKKRLGKAHFCSTDRRKNV